jgi:hypothetical protein
MSRRRFVVRTLLLANFFEPAAEMAEQRRKGSSDPRALIGAMKRTELADQMLERELNAFADKGLEIVGTVQHPFNEAYQHDLLVTILLAHNVEDKS